MKTWFSQQTLKAIRKKRRTYKKMKRTGRYLGQYRAISNTVWDLTRRDHKQHVERITTNLGSTPKPFWKWLRNNRSQLNTIPELTFKGEKFTSDVWKAEALITCFKPAFTSEDTLGLGKLQLELTGKRSMNSIAELTITEEEVYVIVITQSRVLYTGYWHCMRPCYNYYINPGWEQWNFCSWTLKMFSLIGLIFW